VGVPGSSYWWWDERRGSCDNFQFSRWIATVVHAGTQAIRAEQAAGTTHRAGPDFGPTLGQLWANFNSLW
jgi:hypothetical protein